MSNTDSAKSESSLAMHQNQVKCCFKHTNSIIYRTFKQENINASTASKINGTLVNKCAKKISQWQWIICPIAHITLDKPHLHWSFRRWKFHHLNSITSSQLMPWFWSRKSKIFLSSCHIKHTATGTSYQQWNHNYIKNKIFKLLIKIELLPAFPRHQIYIWWNKY